MIDTPKMVSFLLSAIASSAEAAVDATPKADDDLVDGWRECAYHLGRAAALLNDVTFNVLMLQFSDGLPVDSGVVNSTLHEVMVDSFNDGYGKAMKDLKPLPEVFQVHEHEHS